jgi:SAM-dependent MidA family methyltransferase
MPDTETDTERVRFSEWMARALHDPQRGYYASQVRTVGRRGDFSTSASVGPVLGEAIAAWLNRELERHGGTVHTVIEVGGGDGVLSRAVRRTLGWWRRRRLQWFMVESSTTLRVQQEITLGTGGAHWFFHVADALQACGGRAMIFHNEVLDAFPVTLLQWDATHNRWQEVWLINEGGAWREVLEPVAMLPQEHGALSPSAWTAAPLRDGQRIELATTSRDWLRSWAPHWKAGTMLTVDYGDTFPRVYHRQPRGTVRAYFMQQRLTGPQVYENMGRQDITADVTFTDLIAWGESLGWETVRLCTQREFLYEHVRGLDERSKREPATAFLLDEHGAGSAFKVLIQRTA